MKATDQLLAKYPLISDQISREELGVVLRELETTLQQSVPGTVVEFGCYKGTTSLFIRRLLDYYKDSHRTVGVPALEPSFGAAARNASEAYMSYGERVPEPPSRKLAKRPAESLALPESRPDGAGTPREFHAYDSFEGLPPKSREDQSAAGVDFTAGELAISKKQFLKEFHKAGLQPPITHKGWFNELSDKDIPEEIAFAFLDGDFYGSIRDSLQLVWPRLHEQGVILIHDYKRETLPGVEKAVHEFLQDKPHRLRYEHNIAIVAQS